MVCSRSIPAAQYLRMSTEHQQYSLENQASAIERYAESQGFAIICTYKDVARSGIGLKRRTGLSQLLQDVVSGKSIYRAILVHDVSRWGRFQDIDESAHYEFLCKSAGIPVHYCAETFQNDGTLQSLIMKTLKRTMAREYSRELGVKVLAGQKRLASLGFKQGGAPGYGLRRMLVSSDRIPKGSLEKGERKSITTDRVVLVPGSAHEVSVVREIYRMLISEKKSIYAIARGLNARGVQYSEGSTWDFQAVCGILTHPKYAGVHVFGRTSSRLYTSSVQMSKSEWVVTPAAFTPIVDRDTFEKAQQVLRDRTINKSNEELLQGLKRLLVHEGRLSLNLINACPTVPSPSAFRSRFGSLRRAYGLIGYGPPERFGPVDLRQKTQGLRDQLISRICEMFPEDVFMSRRGGRWRVNLRLREGVAVSVLVGRTVRVWKGAVRWLIYPVAHERHNMTLLAQMDNANKFFRAFYLLPNMDRPRTFSVREADPWLNRGLRLTDLSQFCVAVRKLGSQPSIAGD